MIKVGIIGCGFMGTVHANCYNILKDVKIVGASDISKERAEKIANLTKSKFFADSDELINCSEIDAIDHPTNGMDWTKEVQFIEDVMRGEIRGEDLKMVPELQKYIAAKLEEMDKNIGIMYDQFGKSLTGTTEFVRLVPQILAGLNNLTRAVMDQDKNRERIRELEKKLETLEKKEEFSPFEQTLINIIKQGNFKKYEIIERVKSLKEFSRLPRRRLKREVFAALESLQQKGVITKSKNRYRVGRI